MLEYHKNNTKINENENNFGEMVTKIHEVQKKKSENQLHHETENVDCNTNVYYNIDFCKLNSEQTNERNQSDIFEDKDSMSLDLEESSLEFKSEEALHFESDSSEDFSSEESSDESKVDQVVIILRKSELSEGLVNDS